jgi:hypothetical protein
LAISGRNTRLLLLNKTKSHYTSFSGGEAPKNIYPRLRYISKSQNVSAMFVPFSISLKFACRIKTQVIPGRIKKPCWDI